MSEHAEQPLQTDSVHHTYVTHKVPWYVHLLWIAYLGVAVWYILRYVVPSANQFL